MFDVFQECSTLLYHYVFITSTVLLQKQVVFFRSFSDLSKVVFDFFLQILDHGTRVLEEYCHP